MKNKPSSIRLSNYFAPRIHGNILAWVKPASESEKSQQIIENIQRWEDDGGRVMDELASKDEWFPVRPTGHKQSLLQRLPGEGDTL